MFWEEILKQFFGAKIGDGSVVVNKELIAGEQVSWIKFMKRTEGTVTETNRMPALPKPPEGEGVFSMVMDVKPFSKEEFGYPSTSPFPGEPWQIPDYGVAYTRTFCIITVDSNAFWDQSGGGGISPAAAMNTFYDSRMVYREAIQGGNEYFDPSSLAEASALFSLTEKWIDDVRSSLAGLLQKIDNEADNFSGSAAAAVYYEIKGIVKAMDGMRHDMGITSSVPEVERNKRYELVNDEQILLGSRWSSLANYVRQAMNRFLADVDENWINYSSYVGVDRPYYPPKMIEDVFRAIVESKNPTSVDIKISDQAGGKTNIALSESLNVTEESSWKNLDTKLKEVWKSKLTEFEENLEVSRTKLLDSYVDAVKRMRLMGPYAFDAASPPDSDSPARSSDDVLKNLTDFLGEKKNPAYNYDTSPNSVPYDGLPKTYPPGYKYDTSPTDVPYDGSSKPYPPGYSYDTSPVGEPSTTPGWMNNGSTPGYVPGGSSSPGGGSPSYVIPPVTIPSSGGGSYSGGGASGGGLPGGGGSSWDEEDEDHLGGSNSSQFPTSVDGMDIGGLSGGGDAGAFPTDGGDYASDDDGSGVLPSMFGGGAGGAGGTAGDSTAANGAGANGGYPYMPPMGGMGGAAAQQNEKEREHKTWLEEDEEVWGADPDCAPAVIGRGAVPDQVTSTPGQPTTPRRPVHPTGPARSTSRSRG